VGIEPAFPWMETASRLRPMRQTLEVMLLIALLFAFHLTINASYDALVASRLAVEMGDKFGAMQDRVYGLYWVEYDCPLLVRAIPEQERHHLCPARVAYFRTSNAEAALRKSFDLRKKPGFIVLLEQGASETETHIP